VRRSVVLFFAISAISLTACGSEGQATLIGRVDRPLLSVDRSAIGADATGGFDLVLELGEYASGPTQVTLGGFVLERDEVVLLSSLSLTGATFPVTVSPGVKKSLRLTFDQSPSLPEADALCADDVSYRGSVTDSLSGNKPITLVSVAFGATCTGP